MAFPTQSALLSTTGPKYLTRADNALLDFGTGAFTLELWIKLAATGAGGRALDKRDSGGAGAGYTYYVAGSDRMSLYCGNGSTAEAVTATNGIPDTEWHHIAVTRSSNTITHYLDGVANGTGSLTINIDTGATFAVGYVVSEADGAINARVVLVRVWKVARTEAEILANYCTILGTQTSLSAEWTLDNTVDDNSGNSLTLTNVNSVTFGADVPATCSVSGPANLKTYNTNVKANIKSMNTNLIANVKTFDTNA